MKNHFPKTAPEQIQNSQSRLSSIELLRIIAMFIIVAHHFAYHGAFNFDTSSISLNRLWIQFIQIGGKIGVNIYILVSGYFLVSSSCIKARKVIKLWCQIFFYSVTLYVVFTVMGYINFSPIGLIKSLAPITFSNWWFASTYFVLYLLSPYINILLKTLDQKKYIEFLVFLLLCWCIIPTFTGQKFQSNELLWFVVLYSLAGYIRLYGIKSSASVTKLMLFSAIIIVLTYFTAVIFDYIGIRIPVFGTYATFFYDMQRLPTVIASVLIFMAFINMHIQNNYLINTISSATFGIYLIHDNSFVRPILWNTVFKCASYAKSNLLIPYSLFTIVLVYVVCMAIELIRIHLLERTYLLSIDILSKKLQRKSGDLLYRIQQRYI